MSLLPPGPEKSKVGDVWVDPLTADRFIFTGENLDALNYGWVKHEPVPLQEQKRAWVSNQEGSSQ